MAYTSRKSIVKRRSPKSSFFRLTLMASSQALAVLMSLRFDGSPIHRLGRDAELRVVPPEPQERLRVQEQVVLHSMYSLNSSSGALKSGAIQCLVSLADPG